MRVQDTFFNVKLRSPICNNFPKTHIKVRYIHEKRAKNLALFDCHMKIQLVHQNFLGNVY